MVVVFSVFTMILMVIASLAGIADQGHGLERRLTMGAFFSMVMVGMRVGVVFGGDGAGRQLAPLEQQQTAKQGQGQQENIRTFIHH